MTLTDRVRQVGKLLRLLPDPIFRRGLWHGVGAAIEHRALLRTLPFATLVDVGANVGQFSLLARSVAPHALIFAFEPLAGPADRFRRLFRGDPAAHLFQAAVGPTAGTASMHVSRRPDSSSLLPIGPLQTAFAPGTEAAGREEVRVAPLSALLSADRIRAPALLKIDVQGYEGPVLEGAADLLPLFDWVYCEASFRELYMGQVLARHITGRLSDRGFDLTAVNNLTHDRAGLPVQADFLFTRRKGAGV